MSKTRLVSQTVRVWAIPLLLAGCNARGSESANEQQPIQEESGVALEYAPRDERGLNSACNTGMLQNDHGECVPVEGALTAAGGQTYWVDRRHGSADDRNPGTRELPWKTINRASAALRPGDAVLVRAGVYRESITPRVGGSSQARRVTYAAYPGEEVVVSGADVTSTDQWRPDGSAWRLTWTGPELPMYADEGDSVMRREMLIADGAVLRPVFRREEVVAGTFFVEGSDVNQRAIVARFSDDAPPDRAGLIEVAHRTYLFRPIGINRHPDCGDRDTPGWLHVEGFTFRYATNRAQWGALCGGSESALVENITVEWTNGAGVDGSGRNHVFRNVAANYNGQLGFTASCNECLFEDSEAIGNNWKGYSPFWEAGGGKWHNTSQTIIRRHFAADNGGPGIWLDGGNSHNTIERSVALRNDVAGIMLELETTSTMVQHNLVVDNRWRGFSGSGILSQAASRNAFIHNTVVGNEGSGVWLRLDPDRRAEDGDNILYNNLLYGNAWTSTEEAREISVEGLSLAHSRSNLLEGNVYGRHTVNDLRVSTFFFVPDASNEAGFRSGDIARWQILTGGDKAARLITPTLDWVKSGEIPASETSMAQNLSELLEKIGARRSQYRSYTHPGANSTWLPRRINLGIQ